MKQTDLVRKLEALECLLIRHGGKHDWYRNPRTGASQPVPRHKEVNEMLAKHILKKLGD
jgi:predicted RNA binding protein YcfA (HicA-like mRNA interferase family)